MLQGIEIDNSLKAISYRKNIRRRQDGLVFYDDIKSSLGSSGIDEASNSHISNLLENVINEVIRGEWIVAQTNLLLIPTDVIFTPALKTLIQTGIDNYVTNEYYT